MLIRWEGDTVVKRPEDDADAPRLRHEADMLAAARHSGVVSLLDTGEDPSGPWLTLAGVGGPSLAAALSGPAAGMEVADLARLVGAVATTVADLHDLGLVHGGIDPSHVVLDEKRRPVLCSLGRGGKLGQPLDPSQDVRALGALLEAVLPPDAVEGEDGRRGHGPWAALAALAEEAQAGRTRRWRRRAGGLTARALAASIAKLTPDARPPEARVLRRPASSGHRSVERPVAVGRLAAVVVGVVVVAGLITVGIAVRHLSSTPGLRAVSARSRPTAAPSTRGAINAPGVVAVDYSDGVLTFSGMRYTVGQPGDRVAVGRWACSQPAPAVLQSNGRVYVFDGWATPAHDVQARLLSQVPGAGWLETQPRPGGGACDDLVVGGGPNGAVILRPGPSS